MNYGDNEDMTEAPETEDASENRSDTFYLPSDIDGDWKPGDIIKFRVVGKDSEGNTEVEKMSDESGEDDWGKDLENHMPASMGGRMEG